MFIFNVSDRYNNNVNLFNSCQVTRELNELVKKKKTVELRIATIAFRDYCTLLIWHRLYRIEAR